MHFCGEKAVNDIISFKTKDNIVVTHRVVEIQENNGEKAFITKGDNNSQNDEGYHIQIKLNIKYNRNTNVEMKVMW